MSSKLKDWTQRLSQTNLPVLRHTHFRLTELLEGQAASHHTIANLVAHDVGFSLYFLRQANRSGKPGKEPFATISVALPLLGMEIIEQAVSTLPILEEKHAGDSRRSLINYYSRAAHASIYAQDLISKQRQHDSGAISTAALLHDIGEMSAWNAEPEAMSTIQHDISQGNSLEDATLERLGFTFKELNTLLCDDWRLPSLLKETFAADADNDFRSKTVSIAAAIARSDGDHLHNRNRQQHLEQMATFLKIEQDKANAYQSEMMAQAARLLHETKLPKPAYWLALAGGTGQKKPAPAKPSAQAATKQTKSSSRSAKPDSAPPAARQTASAQGKQKLTLKDSLQAALQEMHKTHDLQRVMFALLDSEKNQLRANLVYDSGSQLSLSLFMADLNKPSIFNLLLKKPQLLHLTLRNREKYLKLIPDAALHCLCDREFLMQSVFLRKRPLGLFYADNGCGSTPISNQQFTNFKAICHRVSKIMPA